MKGTKRMTSRSALFNVGNTKKQKQQSDLQGVKVKDEEKNPLETSRKAQDEYENDTEVHTA